ncbi:PQQ-binding-like beta-propeller repeat protein [Cerasicoccus frondis]|uniref:PQQ-binding-like beta-propeller repeat protein n=1 Tax=Cerasicoccus frondis TaxID=490090 RepID=UPI0028524A7D|nr:PQQ-binding-like beta-propeller repeat protein [Cerasicoccus frondis]
METASKTFLFDAHCTGRSRHQIGNQTPHLRWETRLPNFPPKSPESTAILDPEGNLYFGCHDSFFYSLNNAGLIRWRFPTGNKIYSSPTFLSNNTLTFASGDGVLYCLDLQGSEKWRTRIGQNLSSGAFSEKIKLHSQKSHPLHEINRIDSASSWASPKQLKSGAIIVSGYSSGVSAIDPINGSPLWQIKCPNMPCLSGAALTNDDDILIGLNNHTAARITKDSDIKWQHAVESQFNLWGTPTFDPNTEIAFFPFSQLEDQSIIVAFDPSGTPLWEQCLPAAIRGSLAVTHESLLVGCFYDGAVRIIESKTGTILKSKKISESCFWTTPSILPDNRILLSTIDSNKPGIGRVILLDQDLSIIWEINTGKGHSTPLVDEHSRIYFGSWKGDFSCYDTTFDGESAAPRHQA